MGHWKASWSQTTAYGKEISSQFPCVELSWQKSFGIALPRNPATVLGEAALSAMLGSVF